MLTFLGGSAVGAVGAAGVTAWHNSTERLRERMSASAESFLVAVEEVRSAMRVVSAAAWELVEAKDEAAEATGTILAFDVDAAAAGEQTLRLIQQTTRMIRRFDSIVGQHNPLDTTRRAEAALLLEDAQNAVRALYEEPDSPLMTELAPVLREYVRTQARLVTALQGQGDTALLFTAALHRVHASEARVALNFPATGAELSEVAARADTLKQLVITAHAALHDSTRSDAKPGAEEERQRLMWELNGAQLHFALVANLEIGKRRWPWKKYGD